SLVLHLHAAPSFPARRPSDLGHIPGAVFFDIEALSDHTSPLPHMLPRPETFAVAMRELGVNQDKHLIVYDEGNLFSAPRAWWMLDRKSTRLNSSHVSISYAVF